MPVTSATHNGATTAAQASTASRTPLKTLGQDDFLKLLTMQMSNQDPMNPQSNTDFIAQLAQFSSLEQSKTINSTLTGIQGNQDLAQAASLVGKSVTLKNGTSGIVDSATVDSAKVAWLNVGSLQYRVSDVVTFLPTPNTGSATAGTTPTTNP